MKNALRNGYVLSVLGALLVGGAIVGLVLGLGGSSSSSKPRTGIEISLRRGIYPQLGVALEQPTSWTTSSQAGLLRLASPDAGVSSVSIASIGNAGEDAKLRPALNSQLVQTFRPASVIGRRRSPIGKTPAITTAILGKSAKHRVLILSTAVSSPYRTYSIQVFFILPTTLKPTQQSLLEVQNMLTSVRFFAPTA